MAFEFPSIDILVKDAEEKFESTFSKKPDIAVFAPGRVNLIGEHTDYNNGFVFPMALPLVTVIVGKASEKGICHIASLHESLSGTEVVQFPATSETDSLTPSEPSWANYIKGVLANFLKKVPGFEAVVNSSVPMGGGLSSSAALEVATYTFLEALTGSCAENPKLKALACQKAEHDFAKVPCGIMDQFIAAMGVKGHALLIDCKSMESELVPLTNPSVTFIITNSNVKHSLSGSEYPTRRNQCFEAAELMNKASLREATLHDLENIKDKMDEEMRKRVRHVITEVERTEKAAEALKKQDYTLFGQLMNESHNSLRDDYEVSCPEVDQLVSIALTVPGVFGSRMTGGGFGGCTVTLIKEECVGEFIKKTKENYEGKPTFYVCSPSDGARVIYDRSRDEKQ